MNTRHYGLLIVEDNAEELARAKTVAKEHGFGSITTATTLEDALRIVPSCEYVLTDLFFPPGNVKVDEYVRLFLSHYELSATNARNRLDAAMNSPILKAATFVSGDRLEDFIAYGRTVGFSDDVISATEEKLDELQRAKKSYDECSAVLADIIRGRGLPLGIPVARLATSHGIPAVIVTSTNHHDNYLGPVVPILGVPCIDSYHDGKEWSKGLEKLQTIISHNS